MTTIHICTGSPRKKAQHSQFFVQSGIAVRFVDIPLPETQSADVLQVCTGKLQHATAVLSERPLIVDDVGLRVVGLQGFPGALLKPILEMGGIALLDRLTASCQVGRRVRASFECTLACALPTSAFTVTGHVDGYLDFSIPISGHERDCDRHFLPDPPRDSDQIAEGVQLHRLRALQALSAHSAWLTALGPAAQANGQANPQ